MPTTVKIVFRGLMLLNDQLDGAQKKFMEIGFLDARRAPAGGGHEIDHTASHSPVHVPRILTMEDGILADVDDLRRERELGIVHHWRIDVDDPVLDQVKLNDSAGANLNRQQDPTDTNKRDFRWITDLEGADLHNGSLTSKIDTGNLLMVLTVKHGEFFTKMHSPKLLKRKGMGTPAIYGFSAAATGCDITFNAGGVKLMTGRTGGRLIKSFQPKASRDTVFEICNTPPDFPTDGPAPKGQSHFKMYYDKLFVIEDPTEQFSFTAIGGAPGPDPALCGVVSTGQRGEPL